MTTLIFKQLRMPVRNQKQKFAEVLPNSAEQGM